MKEKLQEYALIAEIISAVAIVISLLFVGFELRRNTETFYAQSRETILAGAQSELSLFLNNPDIHLSVTKNERLTQEENIKLGYALLSIMRTREYSWLQYQDRIIDENQWQSELKVIGITLSSIRARKWWEIVGKQQQNPVFAEFVDDYLRDIPVTNELWESEAKWSDL